jgi:transcriptional regulator with XRE-family HTH domain/quercetin dioxygenase-like cupin family protein
MSQPAAKALARGPTGLGQRLAAYRTARGMKVTQLAREVGVSSSLISQIERQQSQPSVSTLFALAEALDVPVDAFFEDAHPHATEEPAAGVAGEAAAGVAGEAAVGVAGEAAVGVAKEPAVGVAGEAAAGVAKEPAADHAGDQYVVRRGDRSTIDIEGGIRWERLTPLPLDRMDFLEIVYEPRSESHPQLYRHPGTEMLLVLEGRLDIHIGFRRHELAAGDSMHFPSSLPHRYVNPTDEEARAVTVLFHEQSH